MKHIPEKKLFNMKLKLLTKLERKAFEKEYRGLLSEELIIRLKKKTGKGSGWHISLNPRKLKEVLNLVKQHGRIR